MTLGRLVVRHKGQFALGLVTAALEDVVNGGLVLGGKQGEGLLHGFAVELELLGFGLELALELLGLGIVLAPVLFVGVGLGVVDPLLLEVLPAGDLVALHLLLAVPDLLAGDLGGDLGELGGVGRFLLGFRIFERGIVVVQVGKPLGLQLLGQQPHDLGLLGLGLPERLDHRLLDGHMAVQIGHVGDDGELLRRSEGGRQYDIGVLGHFRGIGDHMDEERHLGHDLFPALGAGAGEIRSCSRC